MHGRTEKNMVKYVLNSGESEASGVMIGKIGTEDI